MNNITPKISVIMSVLNGASYMDKGIQSIVNQTFTDWEFIICDDGSTDNTWDILQDYAKKDQRIIPIRNDANKGLAYSLNKCIDKAKVKFWLDKMPTMNQNLTDLKSNIHLLLNIQSMRLLEPVGIILAMMAVGRQFP